MPARRLQTNIPAKRAETSGKSMPEFLALRGLVGEIIAKWRKESGTSLLELEARSGVSDSEISRVETGSQACRLESFIRICAALGLPAGYALDHAVAFETKSFSIGIESHKLIIELANGNRAFIELASQNISALAAFAAQLIFSSRPVDAASIPRYLHHGLEERFVNFGYWLEGAITPKKRLSLLLDLKARPLDTLVELNLITGTILWELIEPILVGNTVNESLRKYALGIASRDPEKPLWLAGEASEKSSGKNLLLTDTETSGLLISEVKAQLPSLRERLNRVTKETGKMSALADFLGKVTGQNVPLASVSRWLSGKREPGGEITLLMLRWVEQQERQK